MSTGDGDLTIDTSPLEQLDKHALLARQDYNFGNTGKWFHSFRGGHYGFNARIYGVQLHYTDIHTWVPRVRLPVDNEYHVASILFNMDSALECFTFMLNALGFGIQPDEFREITNTSFLRRVSPRDIVGRKDSRALCIPGYSKLFPLLQRHWITSRRIIESVTEYHDVSKHRRTIVSGANLRQDVPEGFYEAVKAKGDRILEILLCPVEEILLTKDPKEPDVKRTPTTNEDRVVLEDIVSSFRRFIERSCSLALYDATQSIQLKPKPED